MKTQSEYKILKDCFGCNSVLLSLFENKMLNYGLIDHFIFFTMNAKILTEIPE